MRVLFISLSDFDSFNSEGIYGSLLTEFIKQGHEVTAISPHTRKAQNLEKIQVEKNYILRPYIPPIKKQKFVRKGINTLLFPYFIKKQLKGVIDYKDYDLLLYPTPPTSLTPIVKTIKKENSKIKSFLLLKDIFPQNAIDLKIMKKGVIYSYFRHQEKELYEFSDYIGCMSEANKQFILENNKINKNKVDIIPNSIQLSNKKLDVVSSQEKKNLRLKWKLPQNKRVYVYAGNLGKPQDINYLSQNIKELEEYKDVVHFVICGDGTEVDTIRKLEKESPFMVTYLGKLSKQESNEVVKSADYGLILLDHRFTIPNYPSRLLTYLEFGKPVIAATDIVTDIKDLIQQNNIGFWTESTKLNLKETIEKSLLVDEDEYAKMSKRSVDVLKKNFDVKDAYRKIIEILEDDLNV